MSAGERAIAAALVRHGHEAFRPGQREALEAVLAGRDVVAVLPTGSGKSLIFQLAAELLDGPVVVVSPLVALMRDQVAGLAEVGVAAVSLEGARRSRRRREALERAASGAARIAYLTPEALEDAGLVGRLAGARPALVVVDEAHTLPSWGRGFRPAYLGVADAVDALGRPPVLALTATADDWVRRDLAHVLRMRDPLEIVRGTARPELYLEVVRVERAADEMREVERLVVDDPAPADGPPLEGRGIVYVRTTRDARETARRLRARGVVAEHYHGRRRRADRDRVQDGFASERIRVVVATNAFGLGIDVPDVRWVLHRHVPASIEAYHQEAGRAGRDGGPARCTLVYRPDALGQAAFIARTGPLGRDQVRAVAAALLAAPGSGVQDLARAAELGSGRAARALGILAEHGMAARRRGRWHPQDGLDPDAVSLAGEERREEYERTRLEMMRAYAETDGCRRRFLVEYFGERPPDGRCGFCDNDRAGAAPDGSADRTDLPEGVSLGDAVEHPSFGRGVVRRADDGELVVAFEEAGFRTLDAGLVVETGLLRPA